MDKSDCWDQGADKNSRPNPRAACVGKLRETVREVDGSEAGCREEGGRADRRDGSSVGVGCVNVRIGCVVCVAPHGRGAAGSERFRRVFC